MENFPLQADVIYAKPARELPDYLKEATFETSIVCSSKNTKSAAEKKQGYKLEEGKDSSNTVEASEREDIEEFEAMDTQSIDSSCGIDLDREFYRDSFPDEEKNGEHSLPEYDEDEQLSEYDDDEQLNEYDDDKQLGEYDDDEQLNEYDKDEQLSEYDEDEQLNEYDEDEQLGKYDEDQQLNEYDDDKQLGEHDEDEQLNEYDDNKQLDEYHKGEQLNEYDDEKQLDEYDEDREQLGEYNEDGQLGEYDDDEQLSEYDEEVQSEGDKASTSSDDDMEVEPTSTSTSNTSQDTSSQERLGRRMNVERFLEIFDSSSESSLEASQCEALVHALKNRLAVIQGEQVIIMPHMLISLSFFVSK
jgi:hypothetical protein